MVSAASGASFGFSFNSVAGSDFSSHVGSAEKFSLPQFPVLVSAEGFVNLFSKIYVPTPKPIESNVVLDVHQIACGAYYVGLVPWQGEILTWGQESGGKRGHGIERDFSQPHLVKFLAVSNGDFVSCGEYHPCAVPTSGDLFTWGDDIHNAGLLDYRMQIHGHPFALLLLAMASVYGENCHENSLSDLHECCIRFGEYVGIEFMRLPCQHFFCGKCIKTYTDLHVKEGIVNKFLCPTTECG
ncbi:hypothetical protein Nepgr_001170 [Nepenthes gracilis]|uniref:Uncharacterized protein n=1 Tax=Nepenthes gracilis TaxID=150966 RepID=A0AAD3RX70_NEPGR|nr:hypothetical protein Nepgr_001170 [Nepenthes gracilis]